MVFIDSFYGKRSTKFNDLYWDLDLLRKTLFIDALQTKKIDIDSTDFNAIYDKLLTTISSMMVGV